MTQTPRPVVLIVRDGWGRNPNTAHDKFNAVKLARTPRCDGLLAQYPWTLIHTSSEDVGLPEGTMGNSEVGHQNLGAGRVVDQESVRISKAIRTGEFFENPAFVQGIQHARANGRYVHILGIASDAGVHGLLDHLYACIELCKRHNQHKVALHLFTDGRDTGPYTGKQFIERIEAKCKEIGVGRIATLVGRYYAMDRDNRWERVKRAYDALTGHAVQPSFSSIDEAIVWGSVFNRGKTEEQITSEMRESGEIPTFATSEEAIQDYYDNPTNDSQNGDEFITPRLIGKHPEDTRITDGDTVLFYNYRGDRPREITRAFMQPDFHGNVTPSPDTGKKGFDRGPKLDLRYVCMTAYEEAFTQFPGLVVAYRKPAKMTDIGGEYLSKLGMTQFRCAETEKFPHVTFFFNDYRDEPFAGERREMAQSPRVATYDLKPEMSAHEITDIVLRRIAADDCEHFILVNFANGDMVGHTGKLDAAIKAIEVVDECVGRIVDATLARPGGGGKLIVTADHGNAEQMFDPDTGSPHTAHTLYPVECIVVDPARAAGATGSVDEPSTALRQDGRLADVFPTALQLMGLAKPDAMTGESLIAAE